MITDPDDGTRWATTDEVVTDSSLAGLTREVLYQWKRRRGIRTRTVGGVLWWDFAALVEAEHATRTRPGGGRRRA